MLRYTYIASLFIMYKRTDNRLPCFSFLSILDRLMQPDYSVFYSVCMF
jgi:hypothetical protein